MIYELTHYIQGHMPWLWNIVEWGNSLVFTTLHYKKINDIPSLLEKYTDKFQVTIAQPEDADALSYFFK